MPLPEHEQRELEQIERALYSDDPKFARRMRVGDPQARYERKLLQVMLGIVTGAGLLAAGAVTHRFYPAAAGVAIVLLTLVWALVSWRRYVARDRPGPGRRARMMERMEERWRRRQEGNGGKPGRTRT